MKHRPLTFVGSSRRTLETIIVSSRSVNHPFGRNQVLVCVGEGGIMKKVAIPMVSEISPLYVFARVSLIYPLKQLLGHTQ